MKYTELMKSEHWLLNEETSFSLAGRLYCFIPLVSHEEMILLVIHDDNDETD